MRGAIIHKPQDRTSWLDAGGGVLTVIGITFGAKRVDNFALVRAGDQEKGVPTTVQNAGSEADAPRRIHGRFHCNYPALPLVESG